MQEILKHLKRIYQSKIVKKWVRRGEDRLRIWQVQSIFTRGKSDNQQILEDAKDNIIMSESACFLIFNISKL